MFKMIDTDNSGHITLDELKIGLKQFGADLSETEIQDLMKAVGFGLLVFHNYSVLNVMRPIKESFTLLTQGLNNSSDKVSI